MDPERQFSHRIVFCTEARLLTQQGQLVQNSRRIRLQGERVNPIITRHLQFWEV